tara:strand:- start:1176 stop:1412 length:237 start_codon:yes stop_codon:yes gene_type:complete
MLTNIDNNQYLSRFAWCSVFLWGGRKKSRLVGRLFLVFVPEVGIEPTLLAEHEFESCASTSSAIRANRDDKSNVGKAI